MPWMMVGHVKSVHQKSSANSNDEDGLLAEAAAIFANPDEVLARTGYAEPVLA
jgi:hypothetical protein